MVICLCRTLLEGQVACAQALRGTVRGAIWYGGWVTLSSEQVVRGAVVCCGCVPSQGHDA